MRTAPSPAPGAEMLLPGRLVGVFSFPPVPGRGRCAEPNSPPGCAGACPAFPAGSV
jgi:hypothetical protein